MTFLQIEPGYSRRITGIKLPRRMEYRRVKDSIPNYTNDPILDEIRTITDFVKSREGRVIVHPGFGEPMMDPDFWDIVDYTKSSEMSTVLYTNGTMINEETARRLYDGNVYVLVKTNTLDAEKQDRMVGRRGAVAKIQNALQHLYSYWF